MLSESKDHFFCYHKELLFSGLTKEFATEHLDRDRSGVAIASVAKSWENLRSGIVLCMSWGDHVKLMGLGTLQPVAVGIFLRKVNTEMPDSAAYFPPNTLPLAELQVSVALASICMDEKRLHF